MAAAAIREQQYWSQPNNEVYPPRTMNMEALQKAGYEGLWFVEFYGKRIKTTVTNKGDVVTDWISRVRNSYRQSGDNNIVVGLDIENYFTQPKGGKQRCALLQLCVGTTCLVFQIFNSDYIPESLVSFLKDKRHSFYGVGIDADVELLKVDYELDVTNHMDLRLLASWKLNLNGNPGLKRLAKDVLQVDLDKPKWIHYNWRTEKLSKKQIEYASRDAAASFYIGLNLKKIKTSRPLCDLYDI